MLVNSSNGQLCKGAVTEHIHTAQEKRNIMGLLDGILEQDRKVVDDSIASTNLLHKLAADPQHHPSKMLRFSTRKDRT